MTTQEKGGLRAKITGIFFFERKPPSKPNLIFHGPEISRDFVNRTFLSSEEADVFDQTLHKADICSSLEELYEIGVQTDTNRAIFDRSRIFVDNYIRAKLYRQKVTPEVTGGWIYNALVEAEAISLEDVFKLIKAEAIFSFNNTLSQITINTVTIPVVTSAGDLIKPEDSSEVIKQKMLTQADGQVNEVRMRKQLKGLHVYTPFEVASSSNTDTNNYLKIAAIATGVLGSAIALNYIIGVTRHEKRKSKE